MKYDSIKTPKELLAFMDNIKYGFVSDNGKTYLDTKSEEWKDNWYEHAIVQDKDGVLNSMCGTCYDQVELEKSWFEENNYKCKMFFMWFYVCRPNNIPSHTFLIYEDNKKYYLFEHSDMKNRGIYEFNSESEAIEYAKNNLTNYVYSGVSDIKESERDTFRIYEYNSHQANMHIQEYLDYVTEKELGCTYER